MAEQEQIKEQIQKLLEVMGIEGSVAIEDRRGKLAFNIKTPDSKILIGQYGVNLSALQHLVRILVRPKGVDAASPVEFVLDVENYRKKREEFLEALAAEAAERVRKTQQAIMLKPMSRYDRWVIHNELAKHNDLMTQSDGEEPERRIIIKPKTIVDNNGAEGI